MPDTDRLSYDFAGAAEQLSVSARTVRRMVDAGELPVVTIWGMRRITHQALLAYLADREHGRQGHGAGRPTALALRRAPTEAERAIGRPMA
jgi:excisionase family DNA binding protein